MGDLEGVFEVGPNTTDGEYVRAVTGEDVLAANRRGNLLGDSLQEAVTKRVTIGVVDYLEGVQPEQDDPGMAIFGGSLDLLLEECPEQLLVVEVGESVSSRMKLETLHAVVYGLQRAHEVEHRAQHAVDDLLPVLVDALDGHARHQNVTNIGGVA